jgi:hypothetical protein
MGEGDECTGRLSKMQTSETEDNEARERQRGNDETRRKREMIICLIESIVDIVGTE